MNTRGDDEASRRLISNARRRNWSQVSDITKNHPDLVTQLEPFILSDLKIGRGTHHLNAFPDSSHICM